MRPKKNNENVGDGFDQNDFHEQLALSQETAAQDNLALSSDHSAIEKSI
jgi:hypothetical protein